MSYDASRLNLAVDIVCLKTELDRLDNEQYKLLEICEDTISGFLFPYFVKLISSERNRVVVHDLFARIINDELNKMRMQKEIEENELFDPEE